MDLEPLDNTQRTVLCHYHIYKNSGTTFDALLAKNFKDKHICFDGPFPFFIIDQEQLSRIIERKSEIIAFSSHQIQLPAPTSINFRVLPVVFIRHPLLRIHSIYNFKRQDYDSTSTSKAAQNMSFDDWVTYCFKDKHEITIVSNAQTRLLSAVHRQKPLMQRSPDGMIYDVVQAAKNISQVELLARTEYFGEDVSRFPEILDQYNIEFKYADIKPQNTTSKNLHKSIEERISDLKDSLSENNFNRLIAANEQDIHLFEHSTKLIERAPENGFRNN